MLRILAKTIAHRKQRYPTVGDYFNKGKTTHFHISIMRNWKYEVLVLVHEIVEWSLIRARGIPISEIDMYDMAFEARRLPDDFREPGDCELAPYHKEHKFATFVEGILATQLGVDWETYEKKVNSL